MMKIHHNITSTVLLNASPLHRCITSIVLLLPKDKGRPKIHRLRIINAYESEHNLILNYFWPKKGMQKVEENNWFGDNATGGRKNMSAIETATLNDLIIESHRLTKQPVCIHQDDAMGCYDRIIRTHAIISSHKFGIPDNICKIHLKAHDNMEFKNQINNNSSKITYKSTKQLTMHGQGKDTGNMETYSMKSFMNCKKAIPT